GAVVMPRARHLTEPLHPGIASGRGGCLASAIEETAWESFERHSYMPSARTITSAQVAQPALKATDRKHKATHQPAGNKFSASK
ncbi:hypothetical protein M3D48_08120, partial [Dermabacter vaginalis]|uniref:hypothetical protein n=1 Tax=Dermabacter vaginalis TaxID=1630135 RepID=UPI0037F02FDC|nr:hypothetical protein [Dermabacter vaginalis]